MTINPMKDVLYHIFNIQRNANSLRCSINRKMTLAEQFVFDPCSGSIPKHSADTPDDVVEVDGYLLRPDEAEKLRHIKRMRQKYPSGAIPENEPGVMWVVYRKKR